MTITVGRIVQYILSAWDAEQINRRRVPLFDSASAAQAKNGAQVHVGNTAHEGDVFPMIVCRVWETAESVSVNGQVFLDGNDTLWTTSSHEGTEPGTWHWPTKLV